jgi:oxalate decarboxylase/phosphoglucose isomerase-like protein (cupin superfamily)
MTTNEYTGFSLKANQSIPSIKQDDACLSCPSLFWKYVQQRQPCFIDAIGTTHPWKTLWTVDRNVLEQVAGDQVVQVEKRPHVQDRFGQARTRQRQVEMKLSQFLSLVCNKDSNTLRNHVHPGEYLYLSTQEEEEQEDHDNNTQQPITYIPTPCRQLMQHNIIPSHIYLAGNLRLHSCNLWLGRSKVGSSSGLHHDFHDNFYIVLQGIKRFTLYSPDFAPQLNTVGLITKIYSNGVISYRGRECTIDGVPVSNKDQQTTKLKKQGKRKRDGDHGMVNRKYSKTTWESDDDDECSVDSRGQLTPTRDPHTQHHSIKLLEQEEMESCQDMDSSTDSNEDNDDDEEEEEEEEEIIIGKGFDYISSDESCQGILDLESSDLDDFDRLEDGQRGESQQDPSPPDNFSRIDILRTESEIQSEFPNFHSIPFCTVDVRPGQMLYLPAGWFHEVRSYSDHDQGLNLHDCHVALNYWYHPPCNLDDFQSPYHLS